MFLSFSQIPVLSFSQHLQRLEAGRQVLTIGPGLESCHTIQEGRFIAAGISLVLASIRKERSSLFGYGLSCQPRDTSESPVRQNKWRRGSIYPFIIMASLTTSLCDVRHSLTVPLPMKRTLAVMSFRVIFFHSLAYLTHRLNFSNSCGSFVSWFH